MPSWSLCGLGERIELQTPKPKIKGGRLVDASLRSLELGPRFDTLMKNLWRVANWGVTLNMGP